MSSEVFDAGAMVSTLPTSEEQQRDATAYLTRKGHADLLPVLGLGPQQRRSDPPCPTCGVHKGQCNGREGRPMRRWHIARVRLQQAERRRAADELLDSIIAEAKEVDQP